MTEDMTEEQEKALTKAACVVWDLGLPLVKAIGETESEFQLQVIERFVGFLGGLVERKRKELQDKEGK